MKKHISIISIAAVAACIYFTACKTKTAATSTAATTTNTPAKTYSYSADIKAILDANCAATCHSTIKHAHNIDLSTYESAKAAASNPSFLGSVNHMEGFAPMPAKAPKLDDATIEKLSNWVRNGMPQ